MRRKNVELKEYAVIIDSYMTREHIVEKLKDKGYTEKEINEKCMRIREKVGVHILSTLEQYFNLIDDIKDIASDNYRILNDGKYIVMFTD